MSDLNCQAEIDRVTEVQWSALLDRFEDANIYQTWAYGAVRWGARNVSHLVLKHKGEVIGVAQLRIVEVPVLRCGIAYLRRGPLWLERGRQANSSIIRNLALALREEYVQKRRLFLRVLPNAIIGSQRAQVLETAFSDFKTAPTGRTNVERTFLLELSPPLETLRRRLDPKWRNKLNQGERQGLTVEMGEGPEEYDTFLDIYKEMWRRKRFETSVDVGEFARICRVLPVDLRPKILICRHQGVPVGSIVCSAMGDTGIYLLGATNENGLKTKGANLLQWAMIKWLKEKGFRYYDLGGIDPERNPGVFEFKGGLSGQDVEYVAPLEACESPISSAITKLLDRVRSSGTSKRLQNSIKRASPVGRVDRNVHLGFRE